MEKTFNLREFITEGQLFKEVDDDVRKMDPSLRDMFLEYGTAEEISQYLTSLTKDLGLNGSDAYEGFTKEDFLEDFRNFVADKSEASYEPFNEEEAQVNPLKESLKRKLQKKLKINEEIYDLQRDLEQVLGGGFTKSDAEEYLGRELSDYEASELFGRKNNYRNRWENEVKEGNDAIHEESEEDFANRSFGEWDAAGDDAEMLSMMDGTVNIKNFEAFRHYLTLIAHDWIEEGDWSIYEVKKMINYLLDKQY